MPDDTPRNPDLLVLPGAVSADDPLAGGTIMLLPPRATTDDPEPAPAATAPDSNETPQAPMQSQTDEQPVDYPFFIEPVSETISDEDIERLKHASKTSGTPLEDLVRSYHENRQQLLLEIAEMQRRAKNLHLQILERRKTGGIVPNVLPFNRTDSREPPWYGITLAALLVPTAAERVESFVASFDHQRADTVDGGRVCMHTDRVTVEKGSPQAIRMLVAEAKARGWTSIEACGTKEFCQQLLQAVSEEGGMQLTAWVRGPDRILHPKPLRFDPPSFAGASENRDRKNQHLDPDSREAGAVPRADRKTLPRLFNEPTGRTVPEPEPDPATGEAYDADDPDRPDMNSRPEHETSPSP